MGSEQTISLSEKISDQISGIVLIFSRNNISTNSVIDDDYSLHFIPKGILKLRDSFGVNFSMHNVNYYYNVTKYLAIFDSSIQGSSYNTTSGTNAGITYNNNYYALRAVIGV